MYLEEIEPLGIVSFYTLNFLSTGEGREKGGRGEDENNENKKKEGEEEDQDEDEKEKWEILVSGSHDC